MEINCSSFLVRNISNELVEGRVNAYWLCFLKPPNGLMLVAIAIANSYLKKKKKEKRLGINFARLQAHSGPGEHRGTGNQRRCHKEEDGGRLKPMGGTIRDGITPAAKKAVVLLFSSWEIM